MLLDQALFNDGFISRIAPTTQLHSQSEWKLELADNDEVFRHVFANNLMLSGAILTASILFGIPALFLLFIIGHAIADYIMASANMGESLSDVLLLLLSHAVIELSGFVVIASVSLYLVRTVFGLITDESYTDVVVRLRLITAAKWLLAGYVLILSGFAIQAYVIAPLM